MTDREYNSWQRTLERNVSTRTSLLTFSFTTVLAILGIALSDKGENTPPILYLVPYLLIIPFEGRIAYYRLIHARISAYIEMVIPEDVSLDIAGTQVSEKQTWFFNIIAILNNYEMLFLSIATAIVFYCKYPFPLWDEFSKVDWIMLIVPIIFSTFVGVTVAYTFNYSKWKAHYRKEWEKHRVLKLFIVPTSPLGCDPRPGQGR